MKPRSQWSLLEWLACYVCMFASASLLLFAFVRPHLASISLSVGGSILLAALSWCPNLLLRPIVPRAVHDMESVKIPRVAAFALAISAYVLLAGAVAVWVPQ